jgi:hypothetical protein
MPVAAWKVGEQFRPLKFRWLWSVQCTSIASRLVGITITFVRAACMSVNYGGAACIPVLLPSWHRR